jgi:hypothetical protein
MMEVNTQLCTVVYSSPTQPTSAEAKWWNLTPNFIRCNDGLSHRTQLTKGGMQHPVYSVIYATYIHPPQARRQIMDERFNDTDINLTALTVDYTMHSTVYV